MSEQFERDRHIKYFLHHLAVLPEPYIGLDTSRVTALYFIVHALDLLSALDQIDRAAIIEFIYAQQIVPRPDDTEEMISHYGFRGGPSLGPSTGYSSENQLWRYDQTHLAMTYSALTTLITLGDDLSRVNKDAIISSLQTLQQSSGSFVATKDGSECDMRFLYCACAISAILDDWRGVDKDRAVDYIINCKAWDGALALAPGLEAQGGATFTGVASLVLMNKLEDLPEGFTSDIVHWCLMRQIGGFQGRTNKDPDTCYSFWVGGTLKLLGHFEYTDLPSTAAFILKDCQHCRVGGFRKHPDAPPDLLHAFYSLTWLSLASKADLKRFDCRLAMCEENIPAHLRTSSS